MRSNASANTLRVPGHDFGRATPVELDFIQVEKPRGIWNMARSKTAQVKLDSAGKGHFRQPRGNALGRRASKIRIFARRSTPRRRRKTREGLIIQVVITIFRPTFTLITKNPPAPVMIKRAVNLRRDRRQPHKTRSADHAEADRGDRQDQDADRIVHPRSGQSVRRRHSCRMASTCLNLSRSLSESTR